MTNTSRFIDISKIERSVKDIDPPELEFEIVNISNKERSFLDLLVNFKGHQLRLKSFMI